MNCEECKEQVFELIDREAVDPEGVREILARCPECRSAFEEAKAGLAWAALLPIEEPPAAIDAAILSAASSRRRGIAPLRKRLAHAPPWAAAAIALLAVGVGVWAIPRGVPPERGAAPNGTSETAETALAEKALDEESPVAAEVAQVRTGAEPMAVERRAQRAEAKSKSIDSPAPLAKRAAKSSVEDANRERIGVAPAAPRTTEDASEERAANRSAEADLAAPVAAGHAEDGRLIERCRRQVTAIERQERVEDVVARKPEDELAIGKCYQTLGEVANARRWLKRAAAHRRTRSRAEQALRELGPE